MEYAVHLLNSFMYFHSNLVQEMFASSVQALSRGIAKNSGSFITAASAWSTFFDSAIIVPVAGENYNPSDSGYYFARSARQHLGFREDQIMSPSDALAAISSNLRPIIFVDDFVGTGNQFVGTWYRDFEISGGSKTSFSKIAGVRGTRFFYCPVICTQSGHDEITLQCPSVTLSPAHILSERYSALHPDSLIWPDRLRPGAIPFLEAASKRAGIPDTGGSSPDDWRGYEAKGLAIAIHETIPDATLCLLRWKHNGWHPLMVKS
ncbi:phosphoribosyltransferase-like protein [Terriglobus saanensis]|nr:hypothetical protein [Terriglobus saanensis]